MRRSLVVGNWKMNGSRRENEALITDLTASLAGQNHIDAAVCVPSIYIDQVSQLLQEQSLSYGAQDLSVHISGAYTGELSAAMLVDFACRYVIVGHSERREYHHESDLLIGQKTLAAQQSGLIPIVCVGETLEQREADETLEVIAKQLAAVKSVVGDQGLDKAVIAYEPVWAIGTGLTASPEQAQSVHEYIRSQLGSAAESTQILYGGSVKPDNAELLFKQPDIDGALVGGAALKAQDFFDIISAAK